MNHCHRRLQQAYARAGGDLADTRQAERLTQFIQTQLILLSPAVRQALAVVLEAGERAYYEDVADVLSAREEQVVTAASARKRVSRGMRLLERAIREQAAEIAGESRRRFKHRAA